jgi:16S rRNA A1518/A1519 N6-dimethyltransferase RsmA/KsgA/DIM1 with predicted DNA glycosylase/AP lyase activity
VDSAAVLLEPRTRALAAGETERFLRFAGHCFRHKRKTLRNNLAEIYGAEAVGAWPEAGLRAERISLDGFLDMFGRVRRLGK